MTIGPVRPYARSRSAPALSMTVVNRRLDHAVPLAHVPGGPGLRSDWRPDTRAARRSPSRDKQGCIVPPLRHLAIVGLLPQPPKPAPLSRFRLLHLFQRDYGSPCFCFRVLCAVGPAHVTTRFACAQETEGADPGVGCASFSIADGGCDDLDLDEGGHGRS